MRGIVCENAGELRWRGDLPDPERGPGEAIVRIRRIGICGTDLHAFKGNQPYFTYPRILGHELSGVVEQIGENGEGFREGDPVSIIPYMHCGNCPACRGGRTNCCASLKVLGVHIDGGMRERIAVPVTHLVSAAGITLDQAAVLEPLAIGAHAVRRAAGIVAGATALVIGAGPIGLGVMAFARLAGARVIAMDINDERLAVSQAWAGVHHTVNAARRPAELLADLTDGDFPAYVFDATGHAASMAGAVQWLGHGGTLVYVGLVKADIAISHPEFHKRETTLLGSRNATRDDFDRVLAAVRQGAVDISGYITHRSGFEEMVGQFDRWLLPESGVIKAIVES